MPVAARAAQINRAPRRLYYPHMRPHRARRADDLRHRRSQLGGGFQIGAKLPLRQRAAKDAIEQLFGVCLAERCRPRQINVIAHAGSRAKSRAMSRKFWSSAWPFSEAMLSG